MTAQPKLMRSAESLVDAVIEKTGNTIVLGLPLGLGKPNHFVNALYQRAKDDPGISLTILTALTLEVPSADNELAEKFLDPIRERFFEGYPPLLYASDLRSSDVPENIHIREFYFQPANWIGNDKAQQSYVSVNYTHALSHLIDSGINVIGQLLAVPEGVATGKRADQYSLSCNPDISADLFDRRRSGKLDFVAVGQVNRNLPFMGGAATRDAGDFDYILDDESVEFSLFMPPQKPVTLQNHAIGLHVAPLIADGGTLQIGIGAIGDAVVHALILRHQFNDVFRNTFDKLAVESSSSLELSVFEEGLYGLSEMLVDGFIDLINAGIIRREVDGRIMDAGFFMGSPAFYRNLEALDTEVRDKIAMMPVSFTNALYGDEMAKRQGRQKARFVNTAMMVSLTGAVTSDGLENGQVVSGVGGQYNFVAQAHELEGARAIITLPATRTRKGKAQSNIVWSHGHVTVPRHLRDIVVTEYGIADLRGKTDAEVIAAMLNIADSRFQPELLAEAKKRKKIPKDYEIPPAYCQNSPQRLQASLKSAKDAGHLAPFPLGSDFTEEEEQLTLALSTLKELAGSRRALLGLAWEGWRTRADSSMQACLQRMALDRPASFKDRLLRALILGAMVR